MAELRFSILAESDLLSIGAYTLRTWGEAQAGRYINGIEACCGLLAGNPGLGRACDNIRPGLRRMEHGKHVVFYRQETGGILVVRLLHRSMLPDRYAIDDHEATP